MKDQFQPGDKGIIQTLVDYLGMIKIGGCIPAPVVILIKKTYKNPTDNFSGKRWHKVISPGMSRGIMPIPEVIGNGINNHQVDWQQQVIERRNKISPISTSNKWVHKSKGKNYNTQPKSQK
jgi:hypothetical protein